MTARIGPSFVLFMIAAIGLPGCSSSTRDTATLEGRVSYDGKPVERNQVVFLSPSAGASAMAPLDKDGGFKVQGLVPPGEYVIVIQPPPPPPPESKEKISEKPGAVPNKYRDAKTSDLKVAVKPGKNRFDFDLK